MLGRISLVVSVIGVLPYMWSVFHGDVRPQRTTWGIWTMVVILSVFAYEAVGAGESIWFLIGDLLVTGSIFLVSLFKGEGGWQRLDIVCLAIALLGLAVWQLSSNPLWQMIGTLTADMIAVVPTIKKSLEDPLGDSPSTFIGSTLAALIGIFSVGRWDVILLFYPVYLYTANFLTAAVIGTGRYYAKHKLLKGVDHAS